MLLTCVILLATTWTTICFLDLIFKSCMFYPYVNIMKRSGITIGLFYLKFYTSYCNRVFRKLVFSRRWFRLWFDIGTVVMCLLLVPSLSLLFLTPLASILPEKHADALSHVILQPVILGFNLPISQALYYIISLALCSIVHELGHAVAAARENIPVAGCGFFVFFVVPATFVDISRESLMCLSPWQQLRILSAGIWHNVCLAAIALLLLLSNPVLLSPYFVQGNGVSVIDIRKSNVMSPGGFELHDQIVKVNDGAVYNMESWKSCLKSISRERQPGHCIQPSFLSNHAKLYEGAKCPEHCTNSSSEMCFKIFLEARPEAYACLPVRHFLLEASVSPCYNHSCALDGVCVIPQLEANRKLIKVVRKYGPEVLYVGFPEELYNSVSVSSWIPVQKVISLQVINAYETLLQYIISFSAALAILNLIPCPGLDGQYLCEVLLVHFVLPSHFNRSSQQKILITLKIFGIFLICVNVATGLRQLWSNHSFL